MAIVLYIGYRILCSHCHFALCLSYSILRNNNDKGYSFANRND